MGLDRRIVLHITGEGRYDNTGRYTPGEISDIEVWASVNDGGESDQLTEGGLIVLAGAAFTIRWREDVAAISVRNMQVTFDGRIYDAQTITSFTDRRRTITIRGVEVRE